jgi:hypothetical protein
MSNPRVWDSRLGRARGSGLKARGSRQCLARGSGFVGSGCESAPGSFRTIGLKSYHYLFSMLPILT